MKKHRGILLLAFDLVMVMTSYMLAIILRYDFKVQKALNHHGFLKALPLIAFIYLIVFLIIKTYKSVWDKVSVEEGFRIILANFVAALLILLAYSSLETRTVPISVIIIAFLINTLLQEASRFSYRFYRSTKIRTEKLRNKNSRRILIYGAGNTGAVIAKEIEMHEKYQSYIVGFIDDNPLLKGKYIAGLSVFGGFKVLEKVVREQLIDEIIIAMPSCSFTVQNEIAAKVFKFGTSVKMVPSTDILLSDVNLDKKLKPVKIVDLLQRKEIVINDVKVQESIEGKVILVTGGAGSIGSELVRQIVKYQPKSIVLIDVNENALYSLQHELQVNNGFNGDLTYLIASIRDKDRLDKIFNHYKFDLVFHAAAHKHVPLMESSPTEAIKNNIFGTHNLIECSNKYKVEKFVNISTDKAVNPTNVMGATKRFNEMMLQSQPNNETKFMAVRFGNVLGSNGSVVPLFTKQIAGGGPVTVTHKDITRYFMTIPEAVSLVLQAETYAEGGEIFVLDMGAPVKIIDLARKMIELSGFEVNKDIKIEFTGLRPGEKLFEELLMAEEGLIKTENELIFIAKPIVTEYSIILDQLSQLRHSIDSEAGRAEILSLLNDVVPTYKRTEEVPA